MGVRQVEIDVYADVKGGRYAHPANLKFVSEMGLPADPPFDPERAVSETGLQGDACAGYRLSKQLPTVYGMPRGDFELVEGASGASAAFYFD